jgi:hypothetical protein
MFELRRQDDRRLLARLPAFARSIIRNEPTVSHVRDHASICDRFLMMPAELACGVEKAMARRVGGSAIIPTSSISSGVREWVSLTSLPCVGLHSSFQSVTLRQHTVSSRRTPSQNGFQLHDAPLRALRHHALFRHPRLSANRRIFSDSHNSSTNQHDSRKQFYQHALTYQRRDRRRTPRCLP